jgi:hypothetical protein
LKNEAMKQTSEVLAMVASKMSPAVLNIAPGPAACLRVSDLGLHTAKVTNDMMTRLRGHSRDTPREAAFFTGEA